jgi:hypothetical protein
MAGGTIELTRAAGHWVDRARAYKVFVDGQEVGRIRPGRTDRYPVAPGTHRLQLRIDWCASRWWDVDVPDGGQVTYECRPNAKFYNVLWMIIGRAGDYVALHPAGAGPPR